MNNEAFITLTDLQEFGMNKSGTARRARGVGDIGFVFVGLLMSVPCRISLRTNVRALVRNGERSEPAL